MKTALRVVAPVSSRWRRWGGIRPGIEGALVRGTLSDGRRMSQAVLCARDRGAQRPDLVEHAAELLLQCVETLGLDGGRGHDVSSMVNTDPRSFQFAGPTL